VDTPRCTVVGLLSALVGSAAVVLMATFGASQPAAATTTRHRAPAPRYLTASVDRNAVEEGVRVTLVGLVDAPAAPACAVHVRLDVERAAGAGFTVIRHVTTDRHGVYWVRLPVRRTSRFRVSVPATARCIAAQSPTRTVRVRAD
jgi:hypothetical protein